ARGDALYIAKGKLTFALRKKSKLTTSAAGAPLGSGHFAVQATLNGDGALALAVDGKQVAQGKTAGLIAQQPKAGLFVGSTAKSAVGDYAAPFTFAGKITNVRVKATATK